MAASNAGSALVFPASDGSLGALLAAGGKYYVEIATGPLAGERFDVDTDATIAANDSTRDVTLGARIVQHAACAGGQRPRRRAVRSADPT